MLSTAVILLVLMGLTSTAHSAAIRIAITGPDGRQYQGELFLPEASAPVPIVLMVPGTDGVDQRQDLYRSRFVPEGIGTFTLDIKSGVFTSRRNRPPSNYFVPVVVEALRTLRKRLIKAKVLILDDLGLRNYTHEEATSVMDLLEERYHKAPIIVTSQVEPQGWLKLFEDPVIAEAIVDRLIHPSQKITLKGEKSYREKLTEKRSGLKNQLRFATGTSRLIGVGSQSSPLRSRLNLSGFKVSLCYAFNPALAQGSPNYFKAFLRYAFKSPPPLTLALSLEPHLAPNAFPITAPLSDLALASTLRFALRVL